MISRPFAVSGMNCIAPEMSLQEINKISTLGLAHIGDAVYELLVRTMLCAEGHAAAAELHRMTVMHVNASAQAKAAERLLSCLTAEEAAVYKRGRNAHVHAVPHNTAPEEYHAATGLEALFGWLYLQGLRDRIQELFSLLMEEQI